MPQHDGDYEEEWLIGGERIDPKAYWHSGKDYDKLSLRGQMRLLGKVLIPAAWRLFPG